MCVRVFALSLVIVTPSTVAADDDVGRPVYVIATGKPLAPEATAAARLAEVFQTPGLELRREPVDVFEQDVKEKVAWPGTFVRDALAEYRRRRRWPDRIPLEALKIVLDVERPARSVPDVGALRTAVAKTLDGPAADRFEHLILGADTDDPAAMRDAVVTTFLATSCERTRIVEIGDRDQLAGFLLLTLRIDGGSRRVVGLAVVWD